MYTMNTVDRLKMKVLELQVLLEDLERENENLTTVPVYDFPPFIVDRNGIVTR